jgi:hypothetical protein
MEEDIYCSPTIQCKVCRVNRPATEFAQNRVGAPYTTCNACKEKVYHVALSVRVVFVY